MRAVRLTGTKRVDLIEVPVPEPRSDEVIIEVEQRGICGSDVHAYHGRHPFVPPPVVLGHEFAGRIARCGSGVGGFSEGQRVTVEPSLVCGECHNCSTGRYNICENLRVIGCQTDGGRANVDALITDRFPLERVADAFERIDEAPAEVVKVQIEG